MNDSENHLLNAASGHGHAEEDPVESDARRAFWHSRRGMLELDLLLVPFVDGCYRQLNDADKGAYKALLLCEDADIYAWLMQRSQPLEPELRNIVQRIVQHVELSRP